MLSRILLTALAMMLAGSLAAAQTTQSASDQRLEYRAVQAFNRHDFATALPLLRRLADELKNRPAKLPAIQDRIKQCENQLARAAQAAGSAPTNLPGAPTTQPQRIPHPAPVAGAATAMSIKELGNFDYDPDKGGTIPDDVKRLSGSKIRLSGYMIPIDQADHMTRFALVPSVFSCCFGQPPQVQHTIVCNVPKGKAVSYDPEQIVVEGTLRVQETKDDGYVTSIFQLEPTSVAEAPKEPGK